MRPLAIDMPSLTVSIRIRTPRLYGLRMWLLTRCLSLAAIVAPNGVDLECDIKAKD